MTLAVNPVERALLTRMRAGQLSFARMEWVSDTLINGSDAYTLQLDQALFWSDIGDPSDTDGVQTREWTGTVAFDSTSGNAMRITLKNALASL
jgi:hypothetical protein